MPTRKDARPSLFLLELIIAILFFALGSAVCAQAFARAHTAGRQARELAFASAAAASAADAVHYGGTALEQFKAFFPQAYAQDGALAVSYDAALAPCAPEQGVYTLCVRTRQADGAVFADVSVSGQGGEALYALNVHWPAGQGGTP